VYGAALQIIFSEWWLARASGDALKHPPNVLLSQ